MSFFFFFFFFFLLLLLLLHRKQKTRLTNKHNFLLLLLLLRATEQRDGDVSIHRKIRRERLRGRPSLSRLWRRHRTSSHHRRRRLHGERIGHTVWRHALALRQGAKRRRDYFRTRDAHVDVTVCQREARQLREEILLYDYRQRGVNKAYNIIYSKKYSGRPVRPKKDAIPVEVLITGQLTMWTTRHSVVTRRRHLMNDFDRFFLCAKQLWRMLERALSTSLKFVSFTSSPKTKKDDQIPKNASPI